MLYGQTATRYNALLGSVESRVLLQAPPAELELTPPPVAKKRGLQ